MGYGWVWSFWSIGALVSFLIGYYLYIWNPIIGWRWALGLGAIPALITVVLRLACPSLRDGESPYRVLRMLLQRQRDFL
ncbi:hypothetical protein [Vulcanisaeta sp. JCM 16161]|uniref:hypothetical protein n=1 Tax=Vulcanisaeta sp. JCM 16161 TaxID=1295372 RepID=UPI001FB2E59D|nr:hypothetical protein [Vulcanisaeta sp. JCM 16161]